MHDRRESGRNGSCLMPILSSWLESRLPESPGTRERYPNSRCDSGSGKELSKSNPIAPPGGHSKFLSEGLYNCAIVVNCGWNGNSSRTNITYDSNIKQPERT